MNSTAARSILVAIAYILAYYLSWYFGSLYFNFFPGLLGGGFFPDDAAKSMMGISLGVIVLIVFLFTVFGGRNKYWWIGIALIPAILFEAAIDLLHIYFPVMLGFMAWILGTVANKTLTKLAPQFTAKMQ